MTDEPRRIRDTLVDPLAFKRPSDRLHWQQQEAEDRRHAETLRVARIAAAAAVVSVIVSLGTLLIVLI